MSSERRSLLIRIQRPTGTWVEVGAIHSQDNTNWFQTFDNYWDLADRPVLGQTFESRAPVAKARVSLPRWFSHLLPEGRLRQAVAHAAGVHRATEFGILARLGRDDLPGAIQALPWRPDEGISYPLDSEHEDGEHWESDPVLKFSLAGAQLKFSVSRTNRGLTVPAKGIAGDHIVKLPDSRPGYEGVPEAEFAALSLARTVGIETPKTHLVEVSSIDGLGRWSSTGNELAFAIERYDRKAGGRRVHVEEFAQVVGVSAGREQSKYERANFETVANIAGQLAGLESVGEVIDRIVLNVLVGNGDAHLKNWSLVYRDGMNPALSPVYDVVPTVLYIPGDDLGLKLNGTRVFADISAASFGRLGERTGFGARAATERAAQAAERVLDSWGQLRESLTPGQYSDLTRRLSSLPLAKSYRG